MVALRLDDLRVQREYDKCNCLAICESQLRLGYERLRDRGVLPRRAKWPRAPPARQILPKLFCPLSAEFVQKLLLLCGWNQAEECPEEQVLGHGAANSVIEPSTARLLVVPFQGPWSGCAGTGRAIQRAPPAPDGTTSGCGRRHRYGRPSRQITEPASRLAGSNVLT